MKPVAADALFGEAARKGESLGKIRLGAMERRIEAGDLRNLRRKLHDRANGRQVVRLVQGRERRELAEVVEHRLGHAHGTCVLEAAVDHAMTEADHRASIEQLAPGLEDLARSRAMVEALRRE